ncbi:MAG: polyprenol monophosphomannose synthase [Planctomycetota bacterium]
MSTAIVCVGTYNEIETLPRLAERVMAASTPDRQVELLVVDDNSPDGTGRWCAEQAEREPRFHVIHRPQKLGLGTAMITALRFAVQRPYDHVVTMDADLSHDVSALPALIDGLADADVVIGSRYVPGGEIRNWPLRRRILSGTANVVARALLGLKARDCSSGYRAYRGEALRRIDLDALRGTGYVFYEEILAHLQWAGNRIAEVPITFVDREHGQSKIGWREISTSACTLGVIACRDRRRFPRHA